MNAAEPVTWHRDGLELFFVSALGLFLELMLIRWIGSEMRIFAFYRNFALIAAFLGLGIGFAVHRQSRGIDWYERYFFPLLAILSFLVVVLGRTSMNNALVLNHPNPQEYVWTDYTALDLRWAATVLFYTALFSTSILITLVFVPLGQLIAKRFAAFQPLAGYTINVIGSLAGIVVYTLISWLGWPPPAWFLLAGAMAIYSYPRTTVRRLIVPAVLASVPIWLTLLWPTGSARTLWSPYYRIGLVPEYAPENADILLGYDLTVNQEWHQGIWNFDEGFIRENYLAAPDHFDRQPVDYNVPFTIAPRLDNVLIVGAGTGNDVAAALRAGANRVVAVEIDPTILRLGEELHPEMPYSDPRVIRINQDARSYFRNSEETFDLIVSGRLDSQTLFSTASSVRLDNYVYTIESLSEVRGLLDENGLLVLTFKVNAEFVGERLYRTLTDVFGHSPQVYLLPTEHTLFVIGREPTATPLIEHPLVSPYEIRYRDDLPNATDDWPYLYLQRRFIPTPYLVGLLGIIVIGALILRYALPGKRQFNGHFFLMGAAFFLLETKSITELALLLGSTWIVNAAVIASILTVIVIATMLVERFRPTNPTPFYVVLGVVLVLNYFFSLEGLLNLPLAARVALASLAQAVPIFFAGIIFAITFNQTTSISTALGSNLIGAVFGGVAEYVSLVLGIRSLYLIALILYLGSMWLLRRPAATMRTTARALGRE